MNTAKIRASDQNSSSVRVVKNAPRRQVPTVSSLEMMRIITIRVTTFRKMTITMSTVMEKLRIKTSLTAISNNNNRMMEPVTMARMSMNCL